MKKSKTNVSSILSGIEPLNLLLICVMAVVTIALISMLALFPVKNNAPAPVGQAPVQSETITVEEVETETEPREELHTVTLLATGDNLIHTGIFQSGWRSDGSYDFSHLYPNVEKYVKAADLAIINQETIYTNDRDSYSGYPSFGGPVEIGDAVADAGFDIVTHATNHVFDRGTQGIEDTMDFWESEHPEITYLGVHKSQEDADEIKTVTKNDITFALLNYTYGLNGYILPEDRPYMVDILEEEAVADAIERAKKISDCVIFFLHCGDEYVYDPADSTKYWVDFLLEHGVDITIASHPHVLEPYTELTRSDGHRMIVYYSMGNFISTQDEYHRMIGGFAQLTVEKRVKGDESEINVTSYTLDPTYTHYNHDLGVYTVYKLDDYTEELASEHQLYYSAGEAITPDVIRREFDYIMSTTVTPMTEGYVYTPE